ncbi:E3 ubiquitin-protein ligase MARCHF3-like [Hylaeus volcanicus]|uniref:E3 ubiquitin-protein ligase MARCHF3-like n=1 Tax=Hylaeus volcanicus TaxID=313075 RepID=UPI0023B7812E|nr:E3 ubiquitin-protein ligase MARCHF3-like [Hylaeus volcanicus]
MSPVMVPEGASCNLNDCDTQRMSLGVGQQQGLARSLASVGSSVCRICHTNTSKEPLISPCRCKGTLAYVHLACLERWLNETCRSYCELCRYRFDVVSTPRYRLPESWRIWISHPRNRRNMQSNFLIFALLSVVTGGLVMVCLVGMRYFVIEGKKIGISKLWTRGAIWFFLSIVLLGYVTTLYLLGKDQVAPWYRWWRSTVNVRLITDPQLFRRASDEFFRGYENQSGNAPLADLGCLGDNPQSQ